MQKRTIKPKTEEFDIRWTDRERELIKRASKLKKRTTKGFIRENILAAAEDVIFEHQHRMVLTPKQWEALDSAFSEPPKVIEKLKRALEENPVAPWDKRD